MGENQNLICAHGEGIHISMKIPRQWGKFGYICHFGQKRKGVMGILDFKSENCQFTGSKRMPNWSISVCDT